MAITKLATVSIQQGNDFIGVESGESLIDIYTGATVFINGNPEPFEIREVDALQRKIFVTEPWPYSDVISGFIKISTIDAEVFSNNLVSQIRALIESSDNLNAQTLQVLENVLTQDDLDQQLSNVLTETEINEILSAYEQSSGSYAWLAGTTYTKHDIFKNSGDWYLVLEDYLSADTFQDDLLNAPITLYTAEILRTEFNSAFGTTFSDLFGFVSTFGAVVGNTYSVNGGWTKADGGAATWVCAAYGDMPTAEYEMTISNGLVKWTNGRFWIPSDSTQGYQFEISTSQYTAAQFGVKDDVTFNSYPLIQQISAAIGDSNTIHLLKGVTFIGGSRPRLQDSPVVISASEDAEIKIDMNPNVKDLKLATSIKTSHPSLSRKHRFHKNYNRDWLNALVGASCRTPESIAYNQEGLKFSEDWENWNVSITQQKNSGTAAMFDIVVIWDSTFSTGQEGVYTVPRFNRLYETAVVRDSQAAGTPSDSYVSVTVLFGDERLIVAFREGDDTAKVFHINSSGTLSTIHSIVLPSLAYTLNVEGSLTLGFRMVSPFEVEVYANELLVYRCDTRDFTSEEVEYVGYAITPTLSTKVRFYHPVAIDNRTPVSRRNVHIGVVGDSQSFGAYASIDYATFLKQMLEASVFGEVSIRNEAVSGSSTSSWVNGGVYGGDGGSTPYSLAAQDFSTDHYTVVALGTNDAIAGISVTTYSTYLKTICDAIVADGSVPIICSFPIPKTNQDNYERMPEYIALAKKVARDNGWSFAQNREAYGTKESKLYDSLHPHEVGQVYLASSIYEAITTDNSRKVWANPSNTQTMSTDIKEFSNGWGPFSADVDRTPNIVVERDTVKLSGLISGGAAAASAFTIPYGLNPKRDIFYPVANKSDATYPSAILYINKSGIVQVLGGTLSGVNWWISLDGVSWDL